MRIIALVRCAHFIWGRPCPGGAVTFSCLPKKRVTKKKGTPCTAPARVPCVARQAGRLRNSREPLRGHALRQCSPTAPGLAALLGGAAGAPKTKTSRVIQLRFANA